MPRGRASVAAHIPLRNLTSYAPRRNSVLCLAQSQGHVLLRFILLFDRLVLPWSFRPFVPSVHPYPTNTSFQTRHVRITFLSVAYSCFPASTVHWKPLPCLILPLIAIGRVCLRFRLLSREKANKLEATAQYRF